MLACSPRLIAACHVLHRLLVPRHPSCARIHLTEEKPSFSVYVAIPRLCNCQRTSPPQGRILFPQAEACEIVWTSSVTPGTASLVGVPGIEPGTSSLSGMRSNQLSYTPDTVPSSPAHPPHPRHAQDGGGNRNRTGDLMLAKHVLYQLSYAPKFCVTGRRSKQVRSE